MEDDMGEVMPVVVAGMVVLVLVAAVMAKTQLLRRAVVRPLDQEDMVQRVKVRLSAEQAEGLAGKLVKAAGEAREAGKKGSYVEVYEGAGRLVRFEVEERG